MARNTGYPVLTTKEKLRAGGGFVSSRAEENEASERRATQDFFGVSRPTGRFKGGSGGGGGSTSTPVVTEDDVLTPDTQRDLSRGETQDRRELLLQKQKDIQSIRKVSSLRERIIDRGESVVNRIRFKKDVQETGSPIVTEEEFRSGKTLSQEQFVREREKQVGVKGLIKEGDIPGAVRESSRVVGTNIFKGIDFGRAKLFGGETISPRLQRTGGTIIGETGLFVGASPVFSTTAQIETQLGQVSRVQFLGKSQQVKGGKVETFVRFQSQSGKISEKGIAKSVTTGVDKGGITISKTAGVGRVFKIGAKFPSGKLVIKPGTKFAGGEVALTKQVGKGFVQTSIGKVARGSLTKGNLKPFTSLSAGVKGKTLTFFEGATFTPQGATRSTGLIKSLPSRASSSVFQVTSKGTGVVTKITPSIKQAGVTSLQSIVRASVSKPTTSVGIKPFLSFPTSPTSVQLPKKITTGQGTTLQKQDTILRTNLKTNTFPASRQGHFKIQRQRNIPKNISKSKQIIKTAQIPLVKSSQVSRLGLAQTQALKLRQKVSQRQVQKGVFNFPIPRPRTTPKTPKILPFFLPKGRGTTTLGKRFVVKVRRRGKFETIGVFRDVNRAFSSGQTKVQRGLGQSFKVEGLGNIAKLPKGFYKKVEKGSPVFIEKPLSKINTGSEKNLLSLARNLKGKKKKKKRRKK